MNTFSARNTGTMSALCAARRDLMARTQGRTDDALEDALPAAEVALGELAGLLRLGRDEFTLAFAWYERISQRHWLVTGIQDELPDWSFARVSLQDTRLNLRDHSGHFFQKLREIAQSSVDGRHFDAVVLLDWEDRLASEQPADRQPSTSLLGVFNLGRNLLAESFGCPVIVCVPQHAMMVIQREAPDLVSWKAGAFFFPYDPAGADPRLRGALAAADSPSRPDLAAEQLEATLADLEDPQASALVHDLIPKAIERLARLYLTTLGSPERAIEQFQRLDRWASKHRALRWRWRALRGVHQAKRAQAAAGGTATMLSPWRILRGADSLTEEDPMFGREQDTQEVLKKIGAPQFRCGVLWGETGCGKTSLAQAGLAPALRRQGHLPVVVSAYQNLEVGLSGAIAAGVGAPRGSPTLVETLSRIRLEPAQLVVVLCDQFEQVFGAHVTRSRQERFLFLNSIAACANDLSLPVRFLLLVRADRLYHLAEFDELDPFKYSQSSHPLSPDNRYELRWLRQADAERVLSELRDRLKASWPPELIRKVVTDLRHDGRIRPVEIQLIASGLYLRRVSTLSDYEAAGGKESIVSDYLSATLDTLPEPVSARRVVRALVIPLAPPVRASMPLPDIAREARLPEEAAVRVLNDLIKRRVVRPTGRTSTQTYELVHDFLAEPALRAASTQEIGLSALRTAIARGRRSLGWREYRAAVRSDIAELSMRQRRLATSLMRRTAAKFLALGTTGGAMLFLGLALLLYLTTGHVRIEASPPQPIVVYRGPAIFHVGQGLFGSREIFDTGLQDQDVPSGIGKHDAIDSLSLGPADGCDSKRVRALLEQLEPVTAAEWLCYLDDWDDGFQVLREALQSSRPFIPTQIHEEVRRLRDLIRSSEIGLHPSYLGRADMYLREVEYSVTRRPEPAGSHGSAHQVIAALAQVSQERTISCLLQLLRDRSPPVRLESVEELSTFDAVRPDQGHEIALGIVPLLKDKDVRLAALHALKRYGAQAAVEVVPAVSSLLEDKDDAICLAAADAVVAAGPRRAPVVLPSLLRLRRSISRDARIEAIGRLRRLIRMHVRVSATALRPFLSSGNLIERLAASDALIDMGADQTEAVVAGLVPILNSRSAVTQRMALQRLQRLRSNQLSGAMPALLQLLTSGDDDVRLAAESLVAERHPDQARRCVQSLVPLLARSEKNIRATAIRRLMRFKDAVSPVALSLLMSPSSQARLAAADALIAVGTSRTEAVVEGLLPLLQNKDSATQVQAIRRLRHFGSGHHGRVASALLRQLASSRSAVRVEAAGALISMNAGHAEAITPSLIRVGQDGFPPYSDSSSFLYPRGPLSKYDFNSDVLKASYILARIAANDPQVVTSTFLHVVNDKVMNDRGGTLQARAIEILGHLVPAHASAAKQRLVHLLTDKHDRVKLAAADALIAIDPRQSAMTVPTLVRFLDHDDWRVQWVAASDLGEADPGHAVTVAHRLAAHLADPDPDVRDAVARSLLTIATKQSPTLVFLPMLRDKDGAVRLDGATALATIGGSFAGPVEASALTALRGNANVAKRAIDVMELQEKTHGLTRYALRSIGMRLGKHDIPLLEDENSGGEAMFRISRLLSSAWLRSAAQDHSQLAYRTLLVELSSSLSEQSGVYRRAIISALATWYNLGLSSLKSDRALIGMQGLPQPHELRVRALGEHHGLQVALERTRAREQRRWWLRAAVCQVWVSAYGQHDLR
jgi:hypothetical protein